LDNFRDKGVLVDEARNGPKVLGWNENDNVLASLIFNKPLAELEWFCRRGGSLAARGRWFREALLTIRLIRIAHNIPGKEWKSENSKNLIFEIPICLLEIETLRWNVVRARLSTSPGDKNLPKEKDECE
jgi:hypothetical protein